MNRIVFWSVFVTAGLICIAGWTQENGMIPFPLGQLDPEILNEFYPQIMGEIEKEFVLQNDRRALRSTREYGYSFFKMMNGDFTYCPPPEFLQELGRRVCQALSHPSREFTNIILSYYGEGFHLMPHVDTNPKDHPNKNYYFDEPVYGLILEPDSSGHLYFVYDEINTAPSPELPPILSLEEKPGMIFCLQGDYRKSPYYHGVSKVLNRRISITFRTVIQK